MNVEPPNLPYDPHYTIRDYMEQIGGQKLVDCHVYIALDTPNAAYHRVFHPDSYKPVVPSSFRVLFEMENYNLGTFTIGRSP